jgi:hypothetical protein
LSQITQSDREMALKLLKEVTSHILGQNRATVSNDNGETSFHAPRRADRSGHSLSPAIEAAAAIIAAAREEGRNAREHELLSLTDRDFIIISRKEYDRLNPG